VKITESVLTKLYIQKLDQTISKIKKDLICSTHALSSLKDNQLLPSVTLCLSSEQFVCLKDILRDNSVRNDLRASLEYEMCCIEKYQGFSDTS
jgi:hypothetical protein